MTDVQNEVQEVATAPEAVTEAPVVEAKKESQLQALMENAGITTFVPLAKAVGVAPQQLYSRKAKEGGYKYDSIETYLVKHGDGLTIEQIVEKAQSLLAEKAAKKESKVTDKAAKKEAKEKEKQDKIAMFTVGTMVEYDTYRVHDGVREDYTVTARVEEVGEEQMTLIRVENGIDGAATMMSKSTAAKKLRIAQASNEATA